MTVGSLIIKSHVPGYCSIGVKNLNSGLHDCKGLIWSHSASNFFL